MANLHIDYEKGPGQVDVYAIKQPPITPLRVVLEAALVKFNVRRPIPLQVTAVTVT